MKKTITVVEVPNTVHGKVKRYCSKMGFTLKSFVARVLEDAVSKSTNIRYIRSDDEIEYFRPDDKNILQVFHNGKQVFPFHNQQSPTGSFGV